MTSAVLSSPLHFLDRGWRLVGTAISFAAFGAGAAVGFIIAPLLHLVIRDPERRKLLIRRCIHTGYAAHVELMRIVGVLTYDVSGLENAHRGASIPGGGMLIVANHPSLIDVVFLLSTFRDANCVVKDSFFANPLTAPSVKGADYIPNDDPVQVTAACISRLTNGETLLLFPEGTRTRPNRRPRFGRAAATIAIRAGVPILPVRIDCVPTTLTKSEPWYRIPPRRVRFEARCLVPIDTMAQIENVESEREASIQITAQLHDLLAGETDQSDGRTPSPASSTQATVD